MIINRIFAMPNKWTFEIEPIRKLIYRYGGDFKGWIDPFAGMNSPAEITNDLNPKMLANYHINAHEFIDMFNKNEITGILFDPPYNLSQLKECYDNIGIAFGQFEATKYFSQLKGKMSNIIKPGGIIICCGWNSNGVGKKRGFKMIEILLVHHGRDHYDTIITVEQKIQDNSGSFKRKAARCPRKKDTENAIRL